MKIEDVRKIKAELKGIKLKPKSKKPDRPLNLKQIIFELMPQLEKMRTGGYSYAEIAAELQKFNIAISSQTLSKYMSDNRKKARVQTKAAAPPPMEPAKPAEPQPAKPRPNFVQHDNTPNLENYVHGTRNNENIN